MGIQSLGYWELMTPLHTFPSQVHTTTGFEPPNMYCSSLKRHFHQAHWCIRGFHCIPQHHTDIWLKITIDTHSHTCWQIYTPQWGCMYHGMALRYIPTSPLTCSTHTHMLTDRMYIPVGLHISMAWLLDTSLHHHSPKYYKTNINDCDVYISEFLWLHVVVRTVESQPWS